MNDGWQYQGRQYHMWFGHGTKPKDDVSTGAAKDALKPLADRIHDLGHVLLAGLPASKRHYPAARLDAADHARLDRLMTAVVRALPLGPQATAIRVFGTHPDAPGMASLVKAGRVLAGARTNADLHAAGDATGSAIQEIGLDRFKPFLRQANGHLAAQGGLAAMAKEVAALLAGSQTQSVAATTASTATAASHGSRDQQAVPVSSPTPTIPPPDNVPGGPWKWSIDPKNGRGGKFVGPNGVTASWDEPDGHWDIDDGKGNRTRYNRFGAPITPEEAHSPYRGPRRLPLPFRLFRGLPPLFLLPEQRRWILGEPEQT